MGIKLELAGKPVASYKPRELVVALSELKFVRYCLASVVAVTVGQIVLRILLVRYGWDEREANLGSVAVGSIPNYLINRYWTWQLSGRNRLWGEIVPFWAMAFLGWVLSDQAVAYAANQWEDNPLAIAVAQLSGFGVLWVGRFVILDKVMWRVVYGHLDADAAPVDALLASVSSDDLADHPVAVSADAAEREARTNGDGTATSPVVEAAPDGNGSHPGRAPRNPAAEPTA